MHVMVTHVAVARALMMALLQQATRVIVPMLLALLMTGAHVRISTVVKVKTVAKESVLMLLLPVRVTRAPAMEDLPLMETHV
jgi:hypothetical protein